MCTTCGCSTTHTDHVHSSGHDQVHGHPHGHEHERTHGRTRVIEVERDLLEANDRTAARNRGLLRARHVLALNLVSSPGAGKTTLLVRTLLELQGRHALAVIEGDQATDNDSARVRATGVAAFQVNTGKGCHLDAMMVARGLDALPLPAGGVLFIENVGNLICPASFDLGETRKVLLVSVTEGEDKPLKYPNMVAVSDLLLVSKTDLLPHLRFDIGALEANARRINPRIEILRLSGDTGAGFGDWLAWIERARIAARASVHAAATLE